MVDSIPIVNLMPRVPFPSCVEPLSLTSVHKAIFSCLPKYGTLNDTESLLANLPTQPAATRGFVAPLWRNNKGTTVMHLVAKARDLEKAKVIYKYVEEAFKDAPKEERDRRLKELVSTSNLNGWSPLHAAAKEPHASSMIRWLLNRGADVNATTYSDWTPG